MSASIDRDQRLVKAFVCVVAYLISKKIKDVEEISLFEA